MTSLGTMLREVGQSARIFDKTLDRRVEAGGNAWEAVAQEALDVQLDGDQLADIRARAEADLEALRKKLDALEVATEGFDLDLPPVNLPDPILGVVQPEPLVSSDMELVEHIQLLRARKDYGGGQQ